MSNPVREVLAVLSAAELDRLCTQLRLAKLTTRELRVEALERHYGGSLSALLAELRRSVLVELLRSRQFEFGGQILEFDQVAALTRFDLTVALIAVFEARWTPKSSTHGPIAALRMRVIDWGEVTDSEPVLLLPQTHDELAPLASWPTFETLSAHTADAWTRFSRDALQDFQQEAVDRLASQFLHPRTGPAMRGILVLPTGGGKTRTSLQFLLDAYVTTGQRVLWVTHRRDLIDQVHAELRSLAWLTAGVRSFSVSRLHAGANDLSGDVVLASASTLVRRQFDRSAFDGLDKRLGIVCFDEAHHAVTEGTWAALERIVGEDVPLLSLTATPYRTESGGQAKLDRNLGPVLYTKSFADLVRRGFLARPIFVRQTLESTKALRLSDLEDGPLMSRDDLSDEVVRRVARTPGRNEEIVSHWAKSQELFGKTVAFACDIEHAESLARRFSERCQQVGVVHSQQDRDTRIREIETFRRARGPSVLVNVGLLTEGANIPDTQTVLVARPTASSSLFHQMIGRGARGEKVVPGKKTFHVIDCVDGLAAHGVQLAGERIAGEFEIPAEIRSDLREPSDLRASFSGRVSLVAPEPLDDETASHLARGVSFACAWLALSNQLPTHVSLSAAVVFEFDGAPRIAPVFVETAPAVELALELLGAVLPGGRWSDVEAKAQSLSQQGAFHEIEWLRAVAHARSIGRAPELLQGELVRRDYSHERSVGLVIAEHAQRVGHSNESLRSEWIARWFEEVPALSALYGGSIDGYARDLDVLRAHATFIASEAVDTSFVDESQAGLSAPEPSAPEPSDVLATAVPVESVVEAFTRLCISIALADHEFADSERAVIRKAIESVLLAEAPSLDAVFIVDPFDDSLRPTIREACDVLCEALSWDARSAALDWLIRVALADDRLHVGEIVAIQSIATDLGIPPEDCARRLGWHDDDNPSKARIILGSTIVCPVCTAAMQLPARFCGVCGVSLVAAPTESMDEVTAEDALAVAIDDRASAGSPSDFAAGTHAEDWVYDQLRALVGEEFVSRNVQSDGGESDVRIRVPVTSGDGHRELHVEVKHAARIDPATIYWSVGEVTKAQLLAGRGVAYFLVIVTPTKGAGGSFDAYWTDDPLGRFVACERDACWEWAPVYARATSSSEWASGDAPLPIRGPKLVHYRIEVDAQTRSEMRACPAGSDAIAPVREWLAGLDRR